MPSSSTFFAVRSLIAIFLLSICASALSTRGFSVSAPHHLAECNMAKFTWRNAVAPVYITVIPEGETRESMVDERVKVRLGDRAAWKVDMVAGSLVSFSVEDSAGHLEMVGPMVIEPGFTDCMEEFEDDAAIESTPVSDFVNQS